MTTNAPAAADAVHTGDSPRQPFDVTIVGGGIVGLAAGYHLSQRPGARLLVIEAEDKLAAHQSGHNSGVIHSGLYYRPGSLKARNCVEGRDLLYRFCAEHGVPHERCGKIVVALDEHELPALAELERRGVANNLQGVQRLTAEQIREYEPHVAGVAGLHIPETGIVDYPRVAEVYAEQIRAAGGEIRTGCRLLSVKRLDNELVLETTQGAIRTRGLIGCAGLQSDRVARLCGLEPRLQIVPFRGEYYELKPEKHSLIKNLVYPVPDARFPFLGVHFTRMIHGGVEAGPNAVLAFAREGYSWGRLSFRDLLQMAGFPGFWRMSWKHWRTGFLEVRRSLSKALFVRDLRRLVPELTADDVVYRGAGVRAQAVERDGTLVDDFRIVTGDRMIHVLNAPSPAATASLSIGKTIAAQAVASFDLK